MKLLSLRLCNLAAFSGEHFIDFAAAPLADCGLFAITGPTGAGKSTLLDALCLALFGNTPRLRQMSAVSSTLPHDQHVQLRDPRTLLRRGSHHAFAEVTFIGIDQQRYRATWRVHRARRHVNGKLQASQQILTRLDPAPCVLNDGKQDFAQRLFNVLGLTFDQFTRAVLLAQAEFSAFLQADDNERSALLERLTNSDIYSRLSRQAYQRYKEMRLQNDGLLSQLEQCRPAAKTLRQEWQQALSTAQQVLKTHRERLSALERQCHRCEQHYALIEQLDSQHRQLTELTAQWTQHTAARDRLAALDRFAPLRSVLNEYQQLSADQTQRDQTHQQHLQAVETARHAVTQARQQLAAQQQQRQTLTQRHQDEQASFDAAYALEQNCRQQVNQLATLAHNLHELQKHCRQNESALNEVAAEHQQLEGQRCTLQQHMPQRQTSAQRLDSLSQRIVGLSQQQQRYQAYLKQAQRYQKALQQIENCRQQQQQTQQQVSHHTLQLHHATTELSIAEQEHRKLDEALSAYSENTLIALRQLITAEQLCPVCGTLHQSCATLSIPTALIEAQRQAAATQRQPAQRRLQQAQHVIDQCRQHQHDAEIRHAQATTRHEEAQQQLRNVTPTASHSAPFYTQRLDRITQRLTAAQKRHDQLATQQQQQHELHTRQQQLEQQRQRLLGIQERDAAYLKRLQQERQQGDQRLHRDTIHLSTLLKEHDTASAWQQTRHHAFQNAQQQEQLAVDQYDEAHHTLTSAQRDYQAHQENWLHYQTRLQACRQQLITWRSAQPSAWQSDEALTQLQQIDSADHAALKAEITALEQAYHQAAARYRSCYQQSEAQLGSEQHQQLDDPKQLLATLSTEHAALVDQQTQQEQNTERHQQTVDTLRLRLKDDEYQRQRLDALKTEHHQAAQAMVRWGQISELIGSADGARFRRMAQQWHLDVLIEHANQHLNALTRRFLLKRGGSELGLMIVDRDMGDEQRSVHSLSGGETFLVSLALALGLAAMASDRLLIGTLFIDEGFGSLDTQSRAMAMDALEALQAQGRQVGIISHVQELHERIPIQIEVKPGGREGSSQVAIRTPESMIIR